MDVSGQWRLVEDMEDMEDSGGQWRIWRIWRIVSDLVTAVSAPGISTALLTGLAGEVLGAGHPAR